MDNPRNPEKYFTKSEWCEKSDYLKLRIKNTLNIYFDMIEAGVEMAKPNFLLDYEKKNNNFNNCIMKLDDKKFKKIININRYPKRKIPAKNYYEEELLDDDCYIYCDICLTEFVDGCKKHPLVHIKDLIVKKVPKNSSRAEETLPRQILKIAPSKIPNAGLGVWSVGKLAMGLMFGPYEGTRRFSDNGGCYSWQIKKNGRIEGFIDGFDKNISNWMRYVNCCRNKLEQNLMAFIYLGKLYYRTVCEIQSNTELLVYYGHDFAKELGIDTKNFNISIDDKDEVTSECNNAENNFMIINKNNNINDENIKKIRYNNKLIREKLYECIICNKKFTTTKYLKIHNNVEHLGERKYECNICNKKFMQLCNLKTHMRIHTGEKPFGCNICGKKFTQSNSLKDHMRIHTGEKSYECNICEKKFTLLCNLKTHMRIHTGEKSYECNICGKNFTVLCNLNIHMRIHTGEKPYECSICKKSFTQSHHLNNHLKIHTGEKPYECSFCEKKFTRSSSLNIHLKNKH